MAVVDERLAVVGWTSAIGSVAAFVFSVNTSSGAVELVDEIMISPCTAERV